MIDNLFKNKKLNIQRSLSFGFTEKEGGYIYVADLAHGRFKMTVRISAEGIVKAEVKDKRSDEIYILHLANGASGSFTRMIRTEYESILISVAENCFDPDIFKSGQAIMVLQYVQKRYEDQPEYLWPKFPSNAVLRRKDNSKWYALLIALPKSKLNIAGNGITEIIVLRINPAETDSAIDNIHYFPGYHMNKKTWITIRLDSGTDTEEILRRIDNSYDMAGKKPRPAK